MPPGVMVSSCRNRKTRLSAGLLTASMVREFRSLWLVPVLVGVSVISVSGNLVGVAVGAAVVHLAADSATVPAPDRPTRPVGCPTAGSEGVQGPLFL